MMVTKVVNGKRVEMTQDEVSAFESARKMPLAKQKQLKKNDVDREYNATLKRGFTDNNGVRWAGTDDARGKMLELASGLGVSDRLPKGRSSIALKDANGTPRSLNKAEVKGLAEAALDFKYDADSNRDRLLDEIDAATTQADLDAVEPASGWPT